MGYGLQSDDRQAGPPTGKRGRDSLPAEREALLRNVLAMRLEFGRWRTLS